MGGNPPSASLTPCVLRLGNQDRTSDIHIRPLFERRLLIDPICNSVFSHLDSVSLLYATQRQPVGAIISHLHLYLPASHCFGAWLIIRFSFIINLMVGYLPEGHHLPTLIIRLGVDVGCDLVGKYSVHSSILFQLNIILPCVEHWVGVGCAQGVPSVICGPVLDRGKVSAPIYTFSWLLCSQCIYHILQVHLCQCFVYHHPQVLNSSPMLLYSASVGVRGVCWLQVWFAKVVIHVVYSVCSC